MKTFRVFSLLKRVESFYEVGRKNVLTLARKRFIEVFHWQFSSTGYVSILLAHNVFKMSEFWIQLLDFPFKKILLSPSLPTHTYYLIALSEHFADAEILQDIVLFKNILDIKIVS